MNFNKRVLAMFAFTGLFSLVMGATDGSFAQENLTSSASQGTDNLTSTSFSASNFTTAGNTTSPLSATGDNATTTSTTDPNAMQNGTAKEASGPLDTIMNFFK